MASLNKLYHAAVDLDNYKRAHALDIIEYMRQFVLEFDTGVIKVHDDHPRKFVYISRDKQAFEIIIDLIIETILID